MTDPRYTKLAKLLVEYSTALKKGDHILLAPPYICSSNDIDMVVERLGWVIDSVLKSAGH